MRNYGGRFLEKDDNGEWHETNENRARKKVSQGKSSAGRLVCARLSMIHTKLVALSSQHFERPVERSTSWRTVELPQPKMLSRE